MKHIFLGSALIVIIFSIAFSSCKKETPDTDTQSAVDNNICETEFGKSMTIINSYAMVEAGIKGMLGFGNGRAGGPTITVDPADTLNGFPVTMTIDYGAGITDSLDNKIRSGQMICVFSNYWHIIGSNVKVTLVNYKVGNIAYLCDSMKITHSAAQSFKHQIFKGKCSSGFWPGVLEWESTRVFAQTEGAGDLNPLNDVFSISGSANGVNRDGKSYSATISSPIIKRSSCSWVESGRLDIVPEGLATRTVDYGSGACDNKATLTINGNVFTFTMN